MKKTKIICTLGPASNNRETLKALMENGMDIARFNFSHGDHEEQKGRSLPYFLKPGSTWRFCLTIPFFSAFFPKKILFSVSI